MPVKTVPFLALSVAVVFGQKFEVAAIKPSTSVSQNSSVIRNLHGRFATTNAALRALISVAYDVREYQITGSPSWFDAEHFDIEAVPENYSANGTRRVGGSEMNTMIRALLEDRFKLVVHRETKEGPIYSLVVGKTGPKFHESSEVDSNGVTTRRGQMVANKVSMFVLARTLASQLSRPVVDNTGLKADYDFKLDWNPDLTPLEDGTVPEGPSIFSAVQEQLGLRLERSKGPVEILVIDHVERPTSN